MEKKIKLDKVTYIRYYDSLPENLVQRAENLYSILKEVLPPQSLNEWVDGFCYDATPKNEIEIWEKLAQKFESLCKIEGAKTKEWKKKIFREIFKESGAGGMEISKEVPSA